MENLKLPIALVLAMAVQLASGVWWVSQQASTISGLEETVSQLGSRMAIEDNINLKRDVANNNDDIGRIWNEVEEVWEEIAGLAATITRVTEVQQRVAIIENELKYLTRGPK